ncbi:MAG: TlpA family protein disulfide reductase [Proteobacteria bacterium]|nr:TlpA family protein disulfide reductase [Pseudomonadota bacterium]
MKRIWYVIVAAGVAILAMPALQYLTRPAAGDAAPHFMLRSGDNAEVSLEGLSGRPVILHFWASWCGVCMRELPSLARLQGDYADRGLAVLAVSIDERPADATAAGEALAPGLAVLFDPDGAVADSYHSFAVPDTVFVDRGGRIAWRGAGPLEWDSPDVRDRVDGLIGGVE